MIKEVVDKKINLNFDKFVDEISVYFGKENKDVIVNRAKNVEICTMMEPGVVYSNDDAIYVSEEPICIKNEDGTLLVIPASVVCNERGNVLLTHALVHALTDELFIKGERDAFNETVVDYIAEDISKNLESKGINVTLSSNPIYDSNSAYARLFEYISAFYERNRQEILDGRCGKCVSFDEDEIEKFINKVQSKLDEMFISSMEEREQIKTNKR